MAENEWIWTAEDEAAYRPLRRKKQRIESREKRDKKRKNIFAPRATRKS